MNKRLTAAFMPALICVCYAARAPSTQSFDRCWIANNRIDSIEAPQEPQVHPDRSTPAETFALMYKGHETHQYTMVLESFSKQQKRFFLFETFFAAGLTSGEQKRKIDAIYHQFDIDVNELGASSKTVANFFERLTDRLGENSDTFVIEINEVLLADAKPDFDPKILSISIDGDRAVVRFTRYIYSRTRESNDSEWVEHRAPYDASLFMRKYEGKWLICPEEEWRDPNFVWSPPDH